jgi:hypothetical protein
VLKYYDRDLTLHHRIEIRKQNALEEVEEPKPEQTLSSLAEGVELVENGIKMSEDVDRTSSEE